MGYTHNLPPVTHRRAISHSTKPNAYMSACLNESKWFMLIVSSKISGDMYRFVPCRVFGAMSTSFDSLKFEKKKVKSEIFF